MLELERATRDIGELLDVDLALIVRVRGGRAEVVTALGLADPPIPRPFPSEALKSSNVFAAQRGGLLLSVFEELALREALVAPVSISGNPLAGFLLVATRQRSRELTHELEEHRPTLMRVAAQIGIDLERAELRQKIGELEAALRAKNELLAVVAHEARAPLSAILNLPERLIAEFRDGPSGPVYTGSAAISLRQLETLSRSGKHLSAVLTDVLEHSKLESGTTALERQVVSVTDVLTQACESCLAVARGRDVDVVTEIGENADAFYGDATRLTQVFINLITNAIKYSPSGGQVVVVATTDAEQILVKVIDRGIGIPREHVGRIFETFLQVPGAQPTGMPGAGLGLSIVRKLVEMHGGSVDVESDVGRGSTFSVRLPRATAANAAARERTPVPEPTSELRGRILIIDDDSTVLSTAQLLLEELGHHIVASTAATDLDHLLGTTEPDLLILDVSLGDTDGVEVLRELREREATRRLPVLVWSGHELPSQMFTDLGARWLRKPWHRNELVQLVSTMLSSG